MLPVKSDKCSGNRTLIGRFSILIFLSAAVSGCAINQSVSTHLETQNITTASIPEQNFDGGIDQSDAKIIADVVSKASASHTSSNLVGWQNSETGNQGSISAVSEFVDNAGYNCKKFETAADTYMGIALYDGEACEISQGRWKVSALKLRTAQ